MTTCLGGMRNWSQATLVGEINERGSLVDARNSVFLTA